ncbi:cobalamin-binding protein [Desertibacillus haloalkaliphilus]|uniref:cobalamin-binding protein n=1 Tax=Desertibacillus haloalkaliphilus TaxID=1328930 RepID=UPI001C25D994|nr:cobalamin-binding protein [Desertibacillus haloalkaliphilus]MBU8905381.1 cobalamin-binding protein [Desertibacillus haloalkaliphilus]
MRIVSICPSNTELLAYLGVTSDIVAVDDYSDWPKEITTLPRLGPDLNIDIDKLETFKPDLVVASLSVPGMEKNVEALKERNIPHVVLQPNSLDEIAEDLLRLGKLVGVEERAKELVTRYHQFIDSYAEQAKGVDIQNLYWEWWPKPIFTPGKTNWLTMISELAGGNNVFADQNKPSVQTDWDDVAGRNPDHICLVWVGVQQQKVNPEIVKKRPGWSELDAIQAENIHILEEPLFCRPSPRLLLGLKRIAAILHPEQFPSDDGIDPLLNK